MGLSGWVDRLATRRPHVLVAEVPGWWHVRLAVEAELARRGGVVVDSPAEADALMVVGDASDEFAELVERLWQQLPGPRARAQVNEVADVATVIDTLVVDLADRAAQTRDTAQRTGFEPGEGDHMAPSGIPLASGADDRDGLEMDVLHLPLGPVLRHWPAGLVVRATLSGDIVTEVEVDHVGPASAAPAPARAPRLQAARCLDTAVNVLALAGSDAQRTAARRLRDRLVLDEDVAAQDVERLGTSLGRSRTLRWMLRDVGRYEGTAVHDRLLATVDSAAAHVTGGPALGTRTDPAALTELLPGMELAQVRLVVASLDPSPHHAGAQVAS